MIAFLTYDLKVAVLIAVYYMFYRLMLSRDTFHRVNRVVLLATAVASFVLPLCVITMHRTVVVSGTAGTVSLDGLTAMVEERQTLLWQTLAVGVFFAGMVATLGYTLISVVRVWQLIRHGEHHPQQDGTVVCVVDGDVSPFSWMRYIVLSRRDYAVQDAAVLAHERGHIRQHHTLDLLLVDTLTALQWFNPAMWMLRQDLRAIHEYEADAAVLSQGINMRQYQYLLIQKSVGRCGYSVVNGINHSTLKNRINMMLNKKTNRTGLLKLLALLPIVGTVLALQAETVTDYVYRQPQKKVVKKGRKDTTIKMNAKTIELVTDTAVYNGVNVNVELDKNQLEDSGSADAFDVVEQMPEFPGGTTELMKFLAENIHYPEAALKTGVQGRVIVQFIVEADGTVGNTTVVRKVNDDLDAEAVRVVGTMPKWKPGMQKGEPVRVKYTLPITFRLS